MKLGVAAIVSLVAATSAPAQPPNIVFILVDDLGWTDTGFMGSDFYETPNIDALAASGVRFTNAYAATTVCSPTRASILTGKYPARLRVTDWIHGHTRPWARLMVPHWTHRLRQEELTIAELLAPAGFASATIGKWHLGDESPVVHGFDLDVGGDHRGQPPSYHAPYRLPALTGPDVEGEYLTDRLTSEAIRFLEAHRADRFFLYLPYYTVHTPIEQAPGPLETFDAKPPGTRHRNPGYAAMIESLDQGVGRILTALERLGVDDGTVVFFTSDNGGLVLPLSPWGAITSNDPLREGKGSSYEGGVRVPLTIRWPGATKAGAVVDTPVISADFFPTIAAMTGLSEGVPNDVDGESLVPLLRGEAIERDALFWHYPHYHPGGAEPYGAVRSGNLKLIELYEDGRVELYDLKDDPGETKNLAAARPSDVTALKKRLSDWRRSVDAQMPTPNPAFDPARETTFAR